MRHAVWLVDLVLVLVLCGCSGDAATPADAGADVGADAAASDAPTDAAPDVPPDVAQGDATAAEMRSDLAPGMCDPLTSDGCGAGSACRVTAFLPCTVTCSAEGAGKRGDACKVAADCGAGLGCPDLHCRAYCTGGCSDPAETCSAEAGGACAGFCLPRT